MKEVITLMYGFGSDAIETLSFEDMSKASEVFDMKSIELIQSKRFGFVILHTSTNGIIQNLSIN